MNDTPNTIRPPIEEACRYQGDTLSVDLYYPRSPGSPTAIEVDLICVRAADGLRISYDFDRDGWSIQQASRFEWEAGDTVCDPDWQEVSFVKAWARDSRDV